MYKLYYSPGACSMAVHTILEEIGAPYAVENANGPDGKRSPEFLKVNPRGAVPVLEIDGKPMREGGAQIVYLCDTHKSPLLPQSGFERAEALEQLMFCNSTLHPAYGRVFGMMKMGKDTPGYDVIQKKYVDAINALWQDVENRLANRAYLCGEKITAGDILLTVIANWSPKMPAPVTLGPKTKDLLARVSKRPSFQKALNAEQVEYKVAA